MNLESVSPLGQARFRIAGFGSAYPSRILANPELAGQLGVDVEWIESRCGIQTRCVAGPDETTHSLAVAAAQALSAAPRRRRTGSAGGVRRGPHLVCRPARMGRPVSHGLKPSFSR